MNTFLLRRRIVLFAGALVHGAISVVLWHFLPALQPIFQIVFGTLYLIAVTNLVKTFGRTFVLYGAGFFIGMALQAFFSCLVLSAFGIWTMQILPQIGLAIFTVLFAFVCEKGEKWMAARDKEKNV